MLRVDGLDPAVGEVLLVDASGRTVFQATHSGAGTVGIPVAELANGAYNMLVRDAAGAVVVRRPVVVQH
ncbi:MAG: hypothetical protein IPG92_13395 [Flavobacteriales bacterium]|nr:hypothetical protein [Flavobacteriales bacterium]